jgi:hypothetical protein
VAQHYWYFLAAGIVNSLWRVTLNSWICLMVEEADPDQVVDMYAWIYISNQLVGSVAPLAGVVIGMFSLVPTMRGLYFFAAFMFTLKAFITYKLTAETEQGRVRIIETRHQSILSALSEYRGVLRDLLRAPRTLYTAALMLILSITMLISGNFWAIIATEKLNVPAENLAWFPFVKSAIMLSFFFLVMPRLNQLPFKLPMIAGVIGFLAGQLLLIFAPEQGYGFLVASVFLEACGFAAVGPQVDRMLARTVDPQDRARIQSLLYVGVIMLTALFGWIAGTLSSMDKSLPFVLNATLFGIGAFLAYRAAQAAQRHIAAEAVAA